MNSIRYDEETYGVEAAAQAYLGKSVDQLSLAESAMLVALKGASLGPTENATWIRQRQSAVLNQMVERGYISEEEAAKAREEQVVIQAQNHGQSQ